MHSDRPPTAREKGNATAVHYIGVLRGSLVAVCAFVLAARATGIADPVLRIFAWIGCFAFAALGIYLVRRSVRRIGQLRSLRDPDAG